MLLTICAITTRVMPCSLQCREKVSTSRVRVHKLVDRTRDTSSQDGKNGGQKAAVERESSSNMTSNRVIENIWKKLREIYKSKSYYNIRQPRSVDKVARP